MSRSTVLCTHSCASAWLRKHLTLIHHPAPAHSVCCYWASARQSLRIVRLHLRYIQMMQFFPQKMRSENKMLSAKCWATLRLVILSCSCLCKNSVLNSEPTSWIIILQDWEVWFEWVISFFVVTPSHRNLKYLEFFRIYREG